MARRRESIFETLILASWWVGVILAALVYGGSFAARSIQTSNPSMRMVLTLAARVGPYLALAFVLAGVISAVRGWFNARMLENQTGLDSLRTLPWKQFENLIAEAYRRQGYEVTERLGGGSDGGVDLTLRSAGGNTLVQCKRWRGRRVPVQVVRELYGVLTSERAQAAKLVATTTFTSEATAFAAGKPIELIDGDALLELLKGVQTSGKIAATEKNSAIENDAAICHLCGSPMVKRTAKRGGNAGQQFWGCSRYPACKGTRSI